MAISKQKITDQYAVYCGDCMEVLASMPDNKVHLSLMSPPFMGLYCYTSDERDFSNCTDKKQFFDQYGYLVKELHRVSLPGRMTAVHCADIPSGNTGHDKLIDFSGDIIRLHESLGWDYVARYSIWKDPFQVYIRTLTKSLRHKTLAEDSSKCSCAAADYLLVFRRPGKNEVPISHAQGLMSYAGAREMPADILKYKGWEGHHTGNKYSQWIWRQYASAFWDDIRPDNVLPFRDCKEPDDEKHVHALQLDVIERAIVLWSNAGETVLTPFMGVGSEVYGAVKLGRRGLGVELKESYYRQSLANLDTLSAVAVDEQPKQRELQIA